MVIEFSIDAPGAASTGISIVPSSTRLSVKKLPAPVPSCTLPVMLTESAARPSAHSEKGAVGLMQVMPYMFRQLEIPGSVAHLEANVEAGCFLLEDNIRRLGEDRGILAYFWGSRIRGDKYLRRVHSKLPGLNLTGATIASAQ